VFPTVRIALFIRSAEGPVTHGPPAVVAQQAGHAVAQAGPAQAGHAAPSVRAASITTSPAVYRVAKGDYLGEVADRYLDDFDRYREVARLNRLADPDRIRPGQLLKLPEGAVDAGARRHATGRLVVTPASPSRPAPGPGATPGGGGASSTTPKSRPSPHPTGRDTTPTVEAPAGQQPAMSTGASRATVEDGINRPLAISAVLAVASIVGAQIGAVLGLRRRPLTRTTVRDLVVGRHRRD
ncbi:LysM peptidoglycan-binding domain-containing protein, partial [Micromonospora chersina]